MTFNTSTRTLTCDGAACTEELRFMPGRSAQGARQLARSHDDWTRRAVGAGYHDLCPSCHIERVYVPRGTELSGALMPYTLTHKLSGCPIPFSLTEKGAGHGH